MESVVGRNSGANMWLGFEKKMVGKSDDTHRYSGRVIVIIFLGKN